MRHVAARIRQVQDILERTILIENVSSYMAFTRVTASGAEIPEHRGRGGRLRDPPGH